MHGFTRGRPLSTNLKLSVWYKPEALASVLTGRILLWSIWCLYPKPITCCANRQLTQTRPCMLIRCADISYQSSYLLHSYKIEFKLMYELALYTISSEIIFSCFKCLNYCCSFWRSVTSSRLGQLGDWKYIFESYQYLIKKNLLIISIACNVNVFFVVTQSTIHIAHLVTY